VAGDSGPTSNGPGPGRRTTIPPDGEDLEQAEIDWGEDDEEATPERRRGRNKGQGGRQTRGWRGTVLPRRGWRRLRRGLSLVVYASCTLVISGALGLVLSFLFRTGVVGASIGVFSPVLLLALGHYLLTLAGSCLFLAAPHRFGARKWAVAMLGVDIITPVGLGLFVWLGTLGLRSANTVTDEAKALQELSERARKGDQAALNELTEFSAKASERLARSLQETTDPVRWVLVLLEAFVLAINGREIVRMLFFRGLARLVKDREIAESCFTYLKYYLLVCAVPTLAFAFNWVPTALLGKWSVLLQVVTSIAGVAGFALQLFQLGIVLRLREAVENLLGDA
jgi:hypothetical protein